MSPDYFRIAVEDARAALDKLHGKAPASSPCGPRTCCAEFARLLAVNPEIETWGCAVCGNQWSAPHETQGAA